MTWELDWIEVGEGSPIHEIQLLTYSDMDGYVIGEMRDTPQGEAWFDELGDEYTPDCWVYLPRKPVYTRLLGVSSTETGSE